MFQKIRWTPYSINNAVISEQYFSQFLGSVIAKYYFKIFVPFGIVGNILSFLAST